MAAEPEFDLVGRVLDNRYRIEELLGSGGMATVYRATHVAISRQVAVKVLDPELRQVGSFSRRFQREARAAGRLDHPNCVAVTDFGGLEDGTPYLVMELVKGHTLSEVIAMEGRLPAGRALGIARHILRGLAHAHSMGLVHRDIKPDNIMLVDRDETDVDFARILDFGIARMYYADNEAEAEKLTQAGMAIGTPSYISPEQALGQEADERSDLYSLTVALFEMLTGSPPYSGEGPLEVVTQHLTAPIPRIGDVAPDVAVPPSLDVLLQRGLAKKPVERPAGVAEYVALVEAAQTELAAGPVFSPMQSPSAVAVPNDGRVASIPPVGGNMGSSALTPGPPAAGASPVTIAGLPRPTASSSPRKRGLMIAAIAVIAVILAVVLATRPSHDERFEEAMQQLRHGKNCEERRAAVTQLRLLGDKRALPALEKARYRMRGGVLGIGDKNTNRCLRKDAEAAIEFLEGQR